MPGNKSCATNKQKSANKLGNCMQLYLFKTKQKYLLLYGGISWYQSSSTGRALRFISKVLVCLNLTSKRCTIYIYDAELNCAVPFKKAKFDRTIWLKQTKNSSLSFIVFK